MLTTSKAALLKKLNALFQTTTTVKFALLPYRQRAQTLSHIKRLFVSLFG